MDTRELVAGAAALVRQRCPIDRPACAIVLGSGLGGLTRRISDSTSVPYGEIPDFEEPSVEGHEGELIHGRLAGAEVLALSGRFHTYEGHSAQQAGFPVRVMAALGAPILILSNAAGGVRRTFGPGTLMAIADHINVAWKNPLIGPVVPGDQRFPDMSEPYDRDLRSLLHATANRLGIPLQDGVYGWYHGPAYETPAEVRMLERFGVDAVGMSTVPEVIVARAIGMRVLGVSCITNSGAGLTPAKISHAEVMAATAAAADSFERLVEGVVGSLSAAG
jgi:purine-nucleoside phosphorylase